MRASIVSSSSCSTPIAIPAAQTCVMSSLFIGDPCLRSALCGPCSLVRPRDEVGTAALQARKSLGVICPTVPRKIEDVQCIGSSCSLSGVV